MKFHSFLFGSILLIAGLAPKFSSAQLKVAGYVLSLEGDTIRGLVKDRSNRKNSSTCHFFADEKSKAKIFQPLDLLGYGTEAGDRYLSRIMEVEEPWDNPEESAMYTPGQMKDTAFVRVLVEGNANLYFYVGKDGRKHYFFSRESGKWQEMVLHVFPSLGREGSGQTMVMKREELYRAALKKTFFDQESFFEEFEKVGLKESELVKLFVRLNEAMGQEPSFVEPYDWKLEAQWGLHTHFGLSTLVNPEGLYYYSPSDALSNFPRVGLGGIFRIYLPRTHRKSALEFGLILDTGPTSKGTYGAAETPTQLTSTSIEIPMTGLYRFKPGANSWFAKLSWMHTFRPDLNYRRANPLTGELGGTVIYYRYYTHSINVGFGKEFGSSAVALEAHLSNDLAGAILIFSYMYGAQISYRWYFPEGKGKK